MSNNNYRPENRLNIPALLMKTPKIKKVPTSINNTTTQEFQIGNSHIKERDHELLSE